MTHGADAINKILSNVAMHYQNKAFLLAVASQVNGYNHLKYTEYGYAIQQFLYDIHSSWFILN